MNNTRIEILCSEGDVGLSCVISLGEDGEYYMDRKIMTSSVGGNADRITMKCEESLKSAIKGCFTEMKNMDYKELKIKVILNGIKHHQYCWDVEKLKGEPILKWGLQAALLGVDSMKYKDEIKLTIIPASEYKLN